MSNLDSEITRTRNHLSALEAAKRITEASPGCTPEELEAAAQVLRDIGREKGSRPRSGKASRKPSRNGVHLPPAGSLHGKTIMECAVEILGERPGEKIFYREIAEEAMRRGYSSGRKGSDAERVSASFSQTMRRESPNADCPIKAEGAGFYSIKQPVK